MIIFTTAFSEYALDAFNLNAMDYLVKPIPFDRFLKAVNKAFDYYNLKNKSQEPAKEIHAGPTPEKYILVKSEYHTQKVDLNDITYIEGLKDYIKIHLANSKPVVTLNSLRNMVEKLPSDQFVRVHKSFIVSLTKVDSISRNRIVIGETYIPSGIISRMNFMPC